VGVSREALTEASVGHASDKVWYKPLPPACLSLLTVGPPTSILDSQTVLALS
jgi:hypothetical protein